jgi:hypothetical protein
MVTAGNLCDSVMRFPEGNPNARIGHLALMIMGTSAATFLYCFSDIAYAATIAMGQAAAQLYSMVRMI